MKTQLERMSWWVSSEMKTVYVTYEYTIWMTDVGNPQGK